MSISFLFDGRSDRRLLRATIEKLGSDLNSRIDKLGSDFNARLDQTNARLDQTNAKIDSLGSDLNSAKKLTRGAGVIIIDYIFI